MCQLSSVKVHAGIAHHPPYYPAHFPSSPEQSSLAPSTPALTCSVGDLADPPILILTLLPPPLSFLVITIAESSTELRSSGPPCARWARWPARGNVLLPCNKHWVRKVIFLA